MKCLRLKVDTETEQHFVTFEFEIHTGIAAGERLLLGMTIGLHPTHRKHACNLKRGPS